MNNNCGIDPKPKSIKGFLRSKTFLRPLLGILVGAAGGFLYYYFVGCHSGSCGITSNPYNSMIAGSLFGFFITGSPCTRCN